MPRVKKPNFMYLEKGDRSGLSRKQKQVLINSIIKIGDKKFTPPKSVLTDKIAMDKWKEIMVLYVDSTVEIVTNADIGVLERYCHLYSEYQQLLLVKKEINEIAATPLMARQLSKDVDLDVRLDKKSILMLRMEAELFLTPLSKSRAIPKSKVKNQKESKLDRKGFRNL